MIPINNKKNGIHNLMYSMILCLVLIVCTVFSGIVINEIVKAGIKTKLGEFTTQVADNTRVQFYSEKEKLEIIAKRLSYQEDFGIDNVRNELKKTKVNGYTNCIGVLLKDGGMVFTDETVECALSFEYSIEKLKAPYMSGSKKAFNNNESRYSYWAVPIEKNNMVVGILYGFVSVDSMSKIYNLNAYDGSANLYVIDESDDTFVVDTRYGKTSKIDKLSSLKYEFDINSTDLILGKQNVTNGRMREKGEKYQIAMTPLKIGNMMVLVTVPNKVVFATSNKIRIVLVAFAMISVFAIIIYMCWILYKIRAFGKVNEQRLTQMIYIQNVQKTLFEAHKNPKMISLALDEVKKELQAEKSFLLSADSNFVKEFYTCTGSLPIGEEYKGKTLTKYFPGVMSLLIKGKSVIYYYSDRSKLVDKIDRENMKKYSVRNMMVVPVMNYNNRLVGILGVINMNKRWTDSYMLDCVASNFLMALNNLKSYRTIHKMGTVDSLTGLENRNSYQSALAKYSKDMNMQICCIYMDANGLHELNNTYGHEAGDRMLKFVAQTLRACFVGCEIYRIGGDEFVTLCVRWDKDEIREKLELFKSKIEKENYCVATGFAWRMENEYVSDTIIRAEKMMYQDKKRHYISKGDLQGARIEKSNNNVY